MQPTYVLLIAATILTLSSTSAFSDTTIAFDPLLMRECPQADGSTLYTNKDLPGCKLMTLIGEAPAPKAKTKPKKPGKARNNDKEEREEAKTVEEPAPARIVAGAPGAGGRRGSGRRGGDVAGAHCGTDDTSPAGSGRSGSRQQVLIAATLAR